MNSRKWLSPPKENPQLLAIISHLSLLLFSGNHLLLLWICLFLKFHINGIIYYVILCARLLSLSMYSVISTSFLFMAKYNIVCLYQDLFIYIHPLMNIWDIPAFWLLWTVLLWGCVYMYLFDYLFSIILGIYLSGEFLGLVVTLCLTF